MKRLSDYKDEEAIDLWMDLVEPIGAITGDENVKKVVKSGKPKGEIAKAILKDHKEEAIEILLRIDDTPIDGLNLLIRLIALLTDIGQHEEIKSFFGFAEQEQKPSVSSISVMESTEGAEK